MATVVKDFKIKSGLIVEGSTATVNNYAVLTKSSADQSYITSLVGGASSSSNTASTIVLRDANGDFAAGEITAETGFVGDLTGDVTGNVTGNVTGTVSDISNHDTDDLSEGLNNLYFTDARAISATAASYDVLGSAATAESNAASYTDGEISTLESSLQTYADTAETDAIASANLYTDGEISSLDASLKAYADTAEADAITSANSYADGLASNYDAAGDAAAAESNANSYTDSLIGDATVDGTGGNTITDRIAAAVADLVDSAPATLDTLNELAAAIGDDANFVTTLTTSIGEKVAKAGDTMTGALTLSGAPTSANHAATKSYVDTAEADANSYTDGEISTLETSLQSYADTAEADAITSANNYTDGEIATVNSTISALDTDDIAEGTGNLYFTDERAQDAFGAMLTGTQTNITVTYDDANGTVSFVAENGVGDSTTDDLTEGSSNLYFTDARAQAAVAADITAAVDAIDTDDIEEGSVNLYFTDARAQAAVASDIATAVAAGDATAVPTYEAVDINSVSKSVAATQTVSTASQVVAYSWAIADYTSAELLVKVADGTHSEVSKVLVTMDSLNNIAITEYGVVGTNGSLSTITAGVNGTDVELLVTTANNNSDVTVAGTLVI